MTRGPWVISKTSTPYGRDAQMFDSFGWRFINPLMKEMYSVDAMKPRPQTLLRSGHDAFVRIRDLFRPPQPTKAARAQAAGRLAKEIAPVSIPQRKGDPLFFSRDEFIKPQEDGGSARRPASPLSKRTAQFTAGNASSLNDGAAVLISERYGHQNPGLRPLADRLSSAVVGVEPAHHGHHRSRERHRAHMTPPVLRWSRWIPQAEQETFAAQVLEAARAAWRRGR